MLSRVLQRPETLLPNHLKVQQGEVPETWPDVTEFARWYLANGAPFMMPHDAEVFPSDDASAVCIFRKGQFQVELYLIHPGPLVPMHEHPGVEVIKYYSGTYQHASDGRFVRQQKTKGSPVLLAGEAHGAGGRTNAPNGFALWAFQHWAEGLTPTTVAARWKGCTVGPKQEALVRRFYPDAYVVRGYADVTKRMSDPVAFAQRFTSTIPVTRL